LGIVAALAASPFWYQKVFFRIEEELRVRVEATLARRLGHLDIHVQAAHLANDGIEVRGLSISEPGADGPQGELAHFDVLFLECRTSPQELLKGEPVITGVRISRPVFRATRRPDGSFSLSKLFPLPKPEGPPPTLTIEGGTIEIFDPLKNPSSMLVLRDLHLSTKSIAGGDDQWPRFEFQGYVMPDHIRRVEWVGTLDPNTKSWTASGTVDGLDISPELRASLPAPVAERLEVLAGLRAPTNLGFKLASDGEKLPRFVIDGQVSRGRIEDPRLPYPLTDLGGSFHFDNEGFRLSNVSARDGQTVWRLKHFAQRGYARKSPFVLEGSGQQVHLDDKWAAALPPNSDFRKYWLYYEPAGDINVVCKLEFDGQELRPNIAAHALGDVSFSFHKFPYRLERGRGSIVWREETLNVSLLAFAGPQPVTMTGQFLNPGPEFTGSIEIQADKVALDDKLFQAVLRPKSHETLLSLNPTGTFKLDARLWRTDPNVREMRHHATVTLDPLNRCSISYDKFPYPIDNLQGVITLDDGHWTFRNLAGTSGTGILHLSGDVSTVPGAPPMQIDVSGQQIELNDELRNALQPGVQRLWDALQPHGRIDVTSQITFDENGQKPSVWLRAIPRDDATSIGTSIEPVVFPYRMRMRGGRIEYKDGHADLFQMRAVHGATELRTEGSCDIGSDGSWRLQLGRGAGDGGSDLTVDRIRLLGEDPELIAALPEALRRAIIELKPGGPINLKGAFDFSKASPDTPLHIGWDVDLAMFQGNLQCGPSLENVFGRVRLMGSTSGQRCSSQGELFVDSLTYKNFQFTNIRGPLWFDNQNVYFGAQGPLAAAGAERPRQITANLLGGTLAGDCQVRLASGPQYHVPEYRLQATLANADLQRFARENLPGNQNLNGKVAATIELHGTPGPRNLAGAGTIHLSDADVYDLPLMVSLLKIARAKPPDSTAFTQADIAFDIQQGEHIILKQINLDGDAISLSGNGELTLDGQTNPIRMRLHTSGGRGGIPIISGMLSEAGKQILLIHVGGTLEHPETRTEPFPVANQALQQFQSNAEQPAAKQTGGFWKTLGFR